MDRVAFMAIDLMMSCKEPSKALEILSLFNSDRVKAVIISRAKAGVEESHVIC
jgi:hypothetical protein